MPKEKIGSNAQFTSVGNSLTVIGSHCYAYSGYLTINDSETTILTFPTGKGYIFANLQVLNGTTSNEDFLYKVYFNNILVAQWHCLQVTDKEINIPNLYPIVIPPYTTVKVTGTNTSSASSRGHTATVTGKVYA